MKSQRKKNRPAQTPTQQIATRVNFDLRCLNGNKSQIAQIARNKYYEGVCSIKLQRLADDACRTIELMRKYIKENRYGLYPTRHVKD